MRLRHSEDWDFYYRVACRYRVGFVSQVLMQYRRHDANMSRNVPEMKRALLFLYEGIFRNADPELRKLRRRCYGKLHAMLAGSFFNAGLYREFGLHACKSLLLCPENVLWFLDFPARRWRRWRRPRHGPLGDRRLSAIVR